LIRDLAKYSKISDKIHKKLENITEQIEDSGYKRKPKENIFIFIERYLKKKTKD
jgi:argininosuccinate lyase